MQPQTLPTVRHYSDGSRSAPSTPWGPGQYVKTYARGVAEIGTAQHGGIRVSRGLAQKRMIPEILACAIERKQYFWFEEDCAFMLVVLSMPEIFKPELLEAARSSVKSSYPDEYTALTGEAVAVAESYELRRRQFAAETRERFVGYSAQGDWAEGVPKGMVQVCGRRASDKAQTEIFVSSEAYATRGPFGYVLPL